MMERVKVRERADRRMKSVCREKAKQSNDDSLKN